MRCSIASARRSTLDLWGELDSDWAVLDCELLPWSAKALELLRTQYAAVGVAATAALRTEHEVLTEAARRGNDDITPLAGRAAERLEMSERFVEAYRRYCWSTDGLDGLRLAPFQVLATEGRLRALDAHPWHIAVADRLAVADPGRCSATRTVTVDLGDDTSVQVAIEWWEQLTGAGGEACSGQARRRRGPGEARIAQPGSSAAAASTCGSSTGPSTRRVRSSTGCASAASATSAAWPSAVRPRHRGTRTLRAQRTAASHPRVRLRRARPRVRTRRPRL